MPRFSTMPPGAFAFVDAGGGLYRRIPRGPGGAYDAVGGLNTSTTTMDTFTPEQARTMFAFLKTRLSPQDLATAWKMIEQRITGDNRPRRSNGNGAHV